MRTPSPLRSTSSTIDSTLDSLLVSSTGPLLIPPVRPHTWSVSRIVQVSGSSFLTDGRSLDPPQYIVHETFTMTLRWLDKTRPSVTSPSVGPIPFTRRPARVFTMFNKHEKVTGLTSVYWNGSTFPTTLYRHRSVPSFLRTSFRSRDTVDTKSPGERVKKRWNE